MIMIIHSIECNLNCNCKYKHFDSHNAGNHDAGNHDAGNHNAGKNINQIKCLNRIIIIIKQEKLNQIFSLEYNFT